MLEKEQRGVEKWRLGFQILTDKQRMQVGIWTGLRGEEGVVRIKCRVHKGSTEGWGEGEKMVNCRGFLDKELVLYGVAAPPMVRGF